MGVRAEYSANSVHMSDGSGWLISCAACGGCFFDVTIRPGQESRIECANPDCGKPVTVDADVTTIRPGR